MRRTLIIAAVTSLLLAVFAQQATGAELRQLPVGSGEEVATGDGVAYWIRHEDRSCGGCDRLLSLDLVSGESRELYRAPRRSSLSGLIAAGRVAALQQVDWNRRSDRIRVLMIADRGTASVVVTRRVSTVRQRRGTCGHSVSPLAVSADGGIAWETIRWRRSPGAPGCTAFASRDKAKRTITVSSPAGVRVFRRNTMHTEVSGFAGRYIMLAEPPFGSDLVVVDLISGARTKYRPDKRGGESSFGGSLAGTGAVLMGLEVDSRSGVSAAHVLFPVAGDATNRVVLPRSHGAYWSGANICGSRIVQSESFEDSAPWGPSAFKVYDLSGARLHQFETPGEIGGRPLEQILCAGDALVLRYVDDKSDRTRYTSYAVALQ